MFDELEYTVHFEYLNNGIRVRGEWFPLLKMEWVEGQTLDQYLETAVKNRSQVKSLLGKFDTMMAEMKAAGIAHGDLQHGNIMVVNGDLRLVDYDGMYVPKLAGWRSLELGHSNYQHPLRSETDFDPVLDNFSAHVIRTSLVTLMEDSAIWNDANVGDECLLFKKRDFLDPDNSELFNHLKTHKSKDVQALATSLAHLCKCLPSEVPYLGTPVEEILSIPVYVAPEKGATADDAAIYRTNRYDTENDSRGSHKKTTKIKGDRFKNPVVAAAGAKLKFAAAKAWDLVAIIAPGLAVDFAIIEGDQDLERAEFAKAIASYTRALQIVDQTKGVTIDGALKTLIMSKIATACMLDHRPALVTHHLKEALKIYCDPKSPYCDKALAHLAVTCFEKGMVKDARKLMWDNFRDTEKLLAFPSLFRGSYFEDRGSVAQLIASLSEVYADAVDDHHLALACCQIALAHYDKFESRANTADHEAAAILRLRRIHCHLNIDQIGSAEQQCTRLWRDKQFLNSDMRARLVFLLSFFESLSGNFDEAFQILTENTTQATVLEKSLKDELRGPLKWYFSAAEFLREMGIRYAAQKMHAESKICYTSAGWMYREFRKIAPHEHAIQEGKNRKPSKKSSKTSFAEGYQLKYIECLIGQYELTEASKLLKRITSTDSRPRVKQLEIALGHAFEAAGDYNSALTLFEAQQAADGEDVIRLKAGAREAQINKAQQLESNGKLKDAKKILESLGGDCKDDIERLKKLIRESELNTAEKLIASGAFQDALNLYLRIEPPSSDKVVSIRYKLLSELLTLGKGHGDMINDYGKLRTALDHLEELAKQDKLAPSMTNEITNQVCSWGLVRGRSFRRWIESLVACIATVEGADSDNVKQLKTYETVLAEKRPSAEPQQQSRNPFEAVAVLISETDQEAELESEPDAESVANPDELQLPKTSALADSLIGQGKFQLHNRRITAALDSFTKAKNSCASGSLTHTKAVLGLSLALFLSEDSGNALHQIDSLPKDLDHLLAAMQELTQEFVVKVENAGDFCYLTACRIEEKRSDADEQLSKVYRLAYDLFKKNNKAKTLEQLDCFAGFARVDEIERELEKLRNSLASEKPLREVQVKIARRWVRQGKFNAAKELLESLDGSKSENLKWCLERQTLSLVQKSCTSERKGDGPLREAFHVLTEMNHRKLLTAEFCLTVGKYLKDNLPHSSVLSGMGKELRRLSELFVSVEGAEGPAAGMLLSRIKGTGY